MKTSIRETIQKHDLFPGSAMKDRLGDDIPGSAVLDSLTYVWRAHDGGIVIFEEGLDGVQRSINLTEEGASVMRTFLGK